MIVEEGKDGKEPLLTKAEESSGKILFTTNKKDSENFHIRKDAIAYVGINIPSYMGGRADPWSQATKIGLMNPYQKN